MCTTSKTSIKERHRQLSFPFGELTCFADKLKRVSLLGKQFALTDSNAIAESFRSCVAANQKIISYSRLVKVEGKKFRRSEVASSRGFKFDNGFCGIDENKGNTMLY